MFGARAGGTSPPSSIRVWQWKSMASLAWSMASSKVSPAEKQPGRSGTTTPVTKSAEPGAAVGKAVSPSGATRLKREKSRPVFAGGPPLNARA